MLTLFKRVKTVFDVEYSKEGKSFQKGFRTCYELFEIGYKKTSIYSFEDKFYKAQHELAAAKDELAKAERQLERRDEKIKELNAMLLQVKGDLMDKKTELTEDARQFLKEKKTLQEKARQLNQLLAMDELSPDFAKRKTVMKLAAIISSLQTPEEKINRLKQIFESWKFDLNPAGVKMKKQSEQ